MQMICKCDSVQPTASFLITVALGAQTRKSHQNPTPLILEKPISQATHRTGASGQGNLLHQQMLRASIEEGDKR